MRKRLWAALLLIVTVIAGCTNNPNIGQATPTPPYLEPTKAPVVQTVVVERVVTATTALATATSEPTLAPTPTNTPTVTPTARPVVARTATSVARSSNGPKPCALDRFSENARFGVQLAVNKRTNGDWEFDPSKTRRVKGDSAHPELATDSDLSGCPVVIEGRKVLVEEHHIWILMPGDGKYLDQDRIFRAKEFSAYGYPSSWNLEDFSANKPPISAEFVTAKRRNQKENGYDWKIVLHTSSGSLLVFDAGKDTPRLDSVHAGNCKLETPQKLNITGVYDAGKNSFNASIGAENCWTVARVDGQIVRWKGAKDNVTYKNVAAYLMPGTWTEGQVQAWTPPSQ